MATAGRGRGQLEGRENSENPIKHRGLIHSQYLHVLTPVSTLANVVAVPLCGLALGSDLAGLLAAGWFPAAAECFNHAGWFLMECIRVSSHWFSGNLA